MSSVSSSIAACEMNTEYRMGIQNAQIQWNIEYCPDYSHIWAVRILYSVFCLLYSLSLLQIPAAADARSASGTPMTTPTIGSFSTPLA